MVSEANFGDYPMASGQSRLGRRFYDEAPALASVKANIGQPLAAGTAFALGLATCIPDDIDWADEVRIAVEERASMSPDALTAMEANLRFDGPETLVTARLWPPHRLAELDLPASQRGRRQGRAEDLREGRKGRVRLESGVANGLLRPRRRRHCARDEATQGAKGRSSSWIRHAPNRRENSLRPDPVRSDERVMDQSEAVVIRQHLIDPEICIRCNTCESTCPVGAISHDSRNYVVDASKCNLCMACIPPCPTGSIDNWR